MALHVFADASYLCRSHARSVAGAIFFLGNHNDPTRISGSIHVFLSIIPCVVAGAGNAEYAALFAARQHAASIRTTLSEMGYPQNPTIIMCDNTSAIGIATDSIKQKRSKAIDMRFHWIRDRVRQSQNLADYFTKNHKTWPTTSPRTCRMNYIHSSTHSWYAHQPTLPKLQRLLES